MRFLIISIIGLYLSIAGGCGRSGVTSARMGEREAQLCLDGKAAGMYSCHNLDLLARVTVAELQGEAVNDVWGWTDPDTGSEYALVGLRDGVSFVDLSDPVKPEVVGKLVETGPTQSKTGLYTGSAGDRGLHDDEEGQSTWRDLKVYKNHLFVVSDGQPHGMQIFNLKRLRNVANPPVTFSHDALYQMFGKAHNIAINEASGFAYATGSDTYGGGLHIIDIGEPLQPQFAGFHSDSSVGYNGSGYVHDTQCVVYAGPDEDYLGDEICFNSSETHLAIANVTDKDSTYTISTGSYPGSRYIHQGWLSESQRYFLLDDELDESDAGHPTRTYIWDLTDLNDPQMIGYHEAAGSSIDHNQYIKGNRVFQANYTAGLRILDIEKAGNGILEELAHFDTYPLNDNRTFEGAWSTYPFFRSGVVLVSDTNNGLFILLPTLD